MVAVLTPKTGGKPIVVDKAVVLIGRHPDCDYILQASRKVSRRHVCIVQVNDKYVVRDLGSMNGVWVNKTRVEREHPIGIGDELSIGDVVYRFEVIQKMPRKPKKPPHESGFVDLAPEPTPANKIPESLKIPTPPGEVDMSRAYPVAIPDEDHSFVVVGDDLDSVKLKGDDEKVGYVDPSEVIVIEPGADSVDEFVPVVNLDEQHEIEDVIILDDPDELDDDIIVLD